MTPNEVFSKVHSCDNLMEPKKRHVLKSLGILLVGIIIGYAFYYVRFRYLL